MSLLFIFLSKILLQHIGISLPVILRFSKADSTVVMALLNKFDLLRKGDYTAFIEHIDDYEEISNNQTVVESIECNFFYKDEVLMMYTKGHCLSEGIDDYVILYLDDLIFQISFIFEDNQIFFTDISFYSD